MPRTAPARRRAPLLALTLLAAIAAPCALLAMPGGNHPEMLVAARAATPSRAVQPFGGSVTMLERAVVVPPPAVAHPVRALARAGRARPPAPRAARHVAVAPPAAPMSGPLAERVLAEARRHQGAPYRYGAAGPYRFDCSGFVMYVFGRFGIRLPHNSAAQYGVVRHISDGAKRPGDLIFTFHGGRIGHVGIYAGGNLMWAAVETGDVVRLQSFTYGAYVVGRVG